MGKRSGIKLIELIVIILLLFVLSLFFVFILSEPVLMAAMTAVDDRGKEIYVSITCANTERKAVGLPPVWPSDAPPSTNHITGEVECFNFTNSTDYFFYLNDGENLGCKEWEAFVDGFDFGKLAGAGVNANVGAGPLSAEKNMWTIAKNISDEMDDIIPILVTRNLDANYLFSKIESQPSSERIPLGESWDTPFSNKGAVIIRKGGGALNMRAKYATPRFIYNGQSFDANANSKYPLKYLTPTKEVLPNR